MKLSDQVLSKKHDGRRTLAGCRVMRLSKTALQPSSNLLLDLEGDFFVGEELNSHLLERASSSYQASTSGRLELASPLDVCSIAGFLELPTAFGSLYLGEVCLLSCACAD